MGVVLQFPRVLHPVRVQRYSRWVDTAYPEFVLVVKSWKYSSRYRDVMACLDVTRGNDVLGSVMVPLNELDGGGRFDPAWPAT